MPAERQDVQSSDPEMLDLSIVIVSWNTRELLRACLDSVLAEPTGLHMEVFVADNASSDGSAEMVRQNFPQVHLIENKENLGFAKANNAVFPLCRGDKVLLLNSDTIVRDHALRTLASFLDNNPQAAAVAPKVEQSEAAVDILGCGRRVTLRSTINHWLFLARLFPRIRAFEGIYYYSGLHDDRTREVDWVSGACMMLPRAAIDQVGPMTERWFMYGEDQEWCARMIEAGWKIYHLPNAVVEHRHSASLEKNPRISMLPLESTREIFIELNHPSRATLWLHDAVRAIGLSIRALAYLFKSFLVAPEQRALWERKARTFLFYAKATVLLLVRPHRASEKS